MTPASLRRIAAWVLVAASLSLMGGCTTLNQVRGGPGQKLDPWESWNRKVFNFNEQLDASVIKPAATVYANVVPELVRQGIDNVFGNFSDAWSAVNSVLQGKINDGAEGVMRVGTNTLFGVGGLFDVARDLGLERRNEDFGQTLGAWGFGAGAYVVWPLFGPSSIRDTVALPLDRAVSPALLIDGGASQAAVTFVQLINLRASLLGASSVIDDIALDKYTFIRDAYLQRRRSLTFDGNEPQAPDDWQEPAASPVLAPPVSPEPQSGSIPASVPASAAPPAAAPAASAAAN